MTTFLTSVLAAASILTSPQTAPKPPSLLEGLKQFEGHWRGEFAMGPMKLNVDLSWKSFGGRWAEVSYAYRNTQLKLESRVLMSPNADQSGFNIWMFGNDAPVPDQMKGVLEGKTLTVLHGRDNQPDVKFWIDDQKNLVMSVVKPDEKRTEIGHGVLKLVTD